MTDSDNIILDKLGVPIFIGSAVITSVAFGNYGHDLRIGKVIEIDDENIKISVEGRKSIKRPPDKLVVLFNPELYL